MNRGLYVLYVLYALSLHRKMPFRHHIGWDE